MNRRQFVSLLGGPRIIRKNLCDHVVAALTWSPGGRLWERDCKLQRWPTRNRGGMKQWKDAVF